MAPLEIRHRSVRPISAKHAQASRFLQQSLKSRVCEECKKERAARAVTTDRQLFTAVRALPHMAITKKEGEYRVTFRLASIVEADQGRHDADWHRDHAERVAYYTDDRDDALGSAKSLSDNMVRVMARLAEQGASQ
ncbi:hypothetical protein [Novosphingobium sp. EMRT-2]|uniref:hypothetical protein n=2 Tax=Sphingomonadaceae TaxID=41297 RepID=UPI002102CD06|nr:hypothetical protein [Novosphingobium sp. EMRT-2]